MELVRETASAKDMTKIEPLCGQPDPDGEYDPCDFLRNHVSPHSWMLDRMVAEALDDSSHFYRPVRRPSVVAKKKATGERTR